MQKTGRSATNLEAAATLALQGLTFLAADTGRFSRFLALTGTGPSELKPAAATIEFQAAVLDHLMRDESLMLTFCTEVGVAPEEIQPAYRLLAGTTNED